jgi:hypothetical protein
MIRYPAIPLRSLLALTCLLVPALGAVTRAETQPYPARTIKLVVPFGPGGPTDVSARIVAQVVQSGLGPSVVIENRPGAGGARNQIGRHCRTRRRHAAHRHERDARRRARAHEEPRL